MTQRLVLMFILALFFTACKTSAPVTMRESQLSYTYTRLKLLDMDQMSELIKERVKSYKKTQNEEILQEAIIICLSRPDEDGLVAKLIETIRFSLDTNELWENAIDKVVQKSLLQLKLESTSQEDQVTHLILLGNLVAEFKPDFVRQYKSPSFETRIIEKIARAKVLVSDRAKVECGMSVMATPQSPSDLAQMLINEKIAKQNPKK